jgi:hypothetical protein
MTPIPQIMSRDPLEWIARFIVWWKTNNSLPTSGSNSTTSSAISTGQFLLVAGSVPDGFLAADNSLVFITEYPDLYNVIGLDFDASPPGGSFRLPPAPAAPTGLTWTIRT